jgi:hypothetical protein
MKAAVIALFFAASAFAQSPPAGLPAACGPKDVSFEVKPDHSQHTLAQPEPGKARVYFIQETGIKVTFGVYPTTGIGIDGAWVGAYKNNSWFSVSVEPGEHHVCANLQSLSTGHQMELAHFTAEAGKIYYFRTRLFIAEGLRYFELNSVDSDEAKHLIASYPLSVSAPRK